MFSSFSGLQIVVNGIAFILLCGKRIFKVFIRIFLIADVHKIQRIGVGIAEVIGGHVDLDVICIGINHLFIVIHVIGAASVQSAQTVDDECHSVKGRACD